MNGSVAHIGFETPENVLIRYPLGGSGTRFQAWLVDQMIVAFGLICLLFALMIWATVVGAMEKVFSPFGTKRPDEISQGVMYATGIAILLLSFGSFLYYFCCEFLMGGQTVGKRLFGLRVVQANGFSLSNSGLFIRNVFRVIDHLPIFWMIPVLSQRTQRPGDMAAGTIVVEDRPAPMRLVRKELAGRQALDSHFSFDQSQLGRLRPIDVEFVERLVDRWDEIPVMQLERLVKRAIRSLVKRMRCQVPAKSEQLTFLEDLLAAEYRRRSRRVS